MKKTIEFNLHEDHLTLLRNFYVSWQWCEFGAPEINPKRPYGNSDVLEDIRELLGFEVGDVYSQDEMLLKFRVYFSRIHFQMEHVLCMLFSSILDKEGMTPGVYSASCDGKFYIANDLKWKRIRSAREDDPVGFLSYDHVLTDFNCRTCGRSSYYCGVCGALCEVSEKSNHSSSHKVMCECGTATERGGSVVFIPLLKRPCIE